MLSEAPPDSTTRGVRYSDPRRPLRRGWTLVMVRTGVAPREEAAPDRTVDDRRWSFRAFMPRRPVRTCGRGGRSSSRRSGPDVVSGQLGSARRSSRRVVAGLAQQFQIGGSGWHLEGPPAGHAGGCRAVPPGTAQAKASWRCGNRPVVWHMISRRATDGSPALSAKSRQKELRSPDRSAREAGAVAQARSAPRAEPPLTVAPGTSTPTSMTVVATSA